MARQKRVRQVNADKRVLTPLTWLIGLSAAFAAINIMSNVSSARIVDLAVFSVDAGTLLFPLTFTLRDFIHRVAGKHIARRVVLISALLTAFASLSFWVVSMLPPDMSVGLQDDFGDVLSTTWRIALAGFISQLVSELIDTEIYSMWVNRFKTRFILGRLIVSNAVSVPIDSILFTLIAFAGVYDSPTLVSIAFGNIVLKYLITLVFAPGISLLPQLPDLSGLAVEKKKLHQKV